MKQLIKKLVPKPLLEARQAWLQKTRYERELGALHRLPKARREVGALRAASDLNLADMFKADEGADWQAAKVALERVGLGNTAGGVNPGDRRALYQLVRYLKPRAILEFGTHIGASTAHMAYALKQLMAEDPSVPRTLLTVDILDVNDPQERHWIEWGSAQSPASILQQLGCGDFVRFHVGNALDFERQNSQKYDLIFLDGDHSAAAVYQEIPAAQSMLNPNGIVLLHDYFPGNAPLWEGSAPIPGPALAVDKLRADGVALTIVPLGALPWPTKRGSNITSLAIAARA